MRTSILCAFLLFLFSCQVEQKQVDLNPELVGYDAMQLSLDEAERLVHLPLGCIDTEYPNKLNQVISSDDDLASPTDLHPAFYGCFDWHSAVHGHWSLVRLLKSFPNLKERSVIIDRLKEHLSKENISGEIEYFELETSQGFERMYGWAWLLKLSEELKSWDDPEAIVLEENLRPLSELIANRVEAFLPKLNYAIRVGTHTNTAFAMTMIYDYAVVYGNESLLRVVTDRAKFYFLNDIDCPLGWEPGGYDFLSPCLEEADLMRRILSKEDFKLWLKEFLPQITKGDFELEPGLVSDREDGHLVHLDGLNYSRAWCLFGIAKTLPEYTYSVEVGNKHIEHSLPSLTDSNYEGGHWLASFALMCLTD